MPGGYGTFAAPTEAQIAVFEQAITQVMGVTYTPLLVATQIVNGTNYLFIAQKTIINATQDSTLETVRIYQALDGTSSLVSIDPFNAN